MNHKDHVALIRDGIAVPSGTWADFGSGSGAFTLALADLISSQGQIYSIDKDPTALHQQERILHTRFPAINVKYLHHDFTLPLDLPPLDGIVMANALHFQQQKAPVLHLIRDYLKPGGRLILVEYNVDRGNPWVPHPISFDTWKTIAHHNGFIHTRLLAQRPSRFLKEIYSSLSFTKPAAEIPKASEKK